MTDSNVFSVPAVRKIVSGNLWGEFWAVEPTMTGERVAGSDEVRGSIPLESILSRKRNPLSIKGFRCFRIMGTNFRESRSIVEYLNPMQCIIKLLTHAGGIENGQRFEQHERLGRTASIPSISAIEIYFPRFRYCFGVMPACFLHFHEMRLIVEGRNLAWNQVLFGRSWRN